MSRPKIHSHTAEADNPAWTKKDFAQARPAKHLLPEIFSKERAEALLAPRGRPKADMTKIRIGIRLSPEVIDHFKARGDGWQTRIDAALRQFIAEHPSVR